MRRRSIVDLQVPDPTHSSLPAALLDQKIAGIFRDRDYAYVPALRDDGTWGIGIAVANENGYHPIDGYSSPTFDRYENAVAFCHGMHKHIKLPPDHVAGIVVSTMGGSTYRGRNT